MNLSIPLVGRAAELEQLRAALASAAAGHGHTVLVEGEPGIGKSRLVSEACELATARGMRVLSARAERLDASRPFGVLTDLLVAGRSADTSRRELARLLQDERGGADGGDREFRIVETLLGLAEDECAEGACAFMVDDLQWADASSVRVLDRLTRLANELPLMIVMARRPEPQSDVLGAFVAGLKERGSGIVQVAPLTPVGVEELVTAVLGVAPGPLLVAQTGAAGGNPLFVIELLETLQAGGSIAVHGAVADVDAVALPSALSITVLHRMSFLPTDVLDVLRTASVLGRTFSVPDLAAATGLTTTRLQPAIRLALDARILEEAGPEVAFRHDLLREALYDDLAHAVRIGLHREVAAALAARGAPAVQVAEHMLHGATLGDTSATDWLQRAAGEVAMRSPAIAADLLGQALQLMDPTDPAVDGVSTDHALSLELAGRFAEASAICRRLLARPRDPRTEARARLCLARVLETEGHVEEALDESTRAADVAGLTPAQRGRVLSNASSLPLAMPRLDLAEELARPWLDAGDAVSRARAALTMGSVALLQGRFGEALEWADAAEVTSEYDPEGSMAQGVHALLHGADFVRAEALLAFGRVADADQALERVRSTTSTYGFRDMQARTHSRTAVHLYAVGAWDEALAEVAALTDIAADIQVRRATMIRALSIAALIALHRGDLGGAESGLAACEPHITGSPYDDQWLWLGRALVLEATSSVDLALDELLRGWERCGGVAPAAPRATLGPDVVRLATVAGAGPAADALVADVDALAEASDGAAWPAATATRCRGLRDGDPSLLVAAVEATRATGQPLEVALACEQAGEALARDDRTVEARAWFDEAILGFEQLGATWDVNRTTAHMRALGLRRGARQSQRRAASGWDALTKSELAVANLVAKGLSNPEIAERLFVSRRTVKAHVSNAFVKLGFSSRVELASEAIRRQG